MKDSASCCTLLTYSAPSNGPWAMRNGNILVLDNRFVLTRSLSLWLKSLGHHVTIQNKASQGILRNLHHFDLVITDQHEWDVTYSDIIQKMLAFHPDVPIVTCSEGNWAIFCAHTRLLEQLQIASQPAEFRHLVETVGFLPATCHAEKRRILVLGEQFPITRVIGRILKTLGFSVTVARNKTEESSLMNGKWNCFDLLISDLNARDMTASPWVGKVIASRPEMPLILCTADHKAIYCSRIAAVESMEFLLTPENFSELLDRMDEILNWRDLEMTMDLQGISHMFH